MIQYDITRPSSATPMSPEEELAAAIADARASKRYLHDIVAAAKEAEVQAARFGVAPNIHLDDFMFQFIRTRTFKGIWRTMEYYFEDGAKSARQLRELCTELGFGERFSLFEFASGYGQVSRHLVAQMPQAQITSCDIHEIAVEFIDTFLGGRAVLSNSVPEKLDAGGVYDVVFALSFFSHMPRSTWGRWVSALYNAVAPGGCLIFTAHGHPSNRDRFPNVQVPEDGFWFNPISEQKDLSTAEYGHTIALPHFAIPEIKKATGSENIDHREEFFWKQDVYIVRKPEAK